MEQLLHASDISDHADLPESSESCPETPIQSLSRDRVFKLLGNRRRRFVLYYLRNSDTEEVTVRELAAEIAAWENGVDPEEVTYKQRKRVYTSLYQSHLSKMAADGVVEYEQDRGNVRLTASGRTLDAYLEVVTGDDVPWSDYFLGLSMLSFAFLTAVVVGFPPFSEIPDGVAGLFVTAAFGLSAAVHMIRTRRSRVIS